MNGFIPRILVLVLATAPPATGGERRSNEPGTPEQHYRALLQQHRDAFEEYTWAFRAAKTPAERQKVVEEKYPGSEKCAAKVLELVEKHPKEPFTEDALIWIITNEDHLHRFRPWYEHKDRYEQIWIMTRGGRRFGVPSKEEQDIGSRATELLLRDHVASARLGPVVQVLASSPDKKSAALCRAILDRNPSKEVQAEAAVALARQMQARLAAVKQLKDNPQLLKSIEQVNGKDYALELQKSDPVQLAAEANRFYGELTEKHLPNMKPGSIAVLCQQLFYTHDSEMLLRALYTGDKRHEVRGVACLALAQVLMGRAARDPRAARESERLLQEAADKYADVKTAFDGPVGRKARSELFDLRHLSVGKPAPEIKGVDQNGRHFKLSDYKGKVVLLDFWSEF